MTPPVSLPLIVPTVTEQCLGLRDVKPFTSLLNLIFSTFCALAGVFSCEFIYHVTMF